MKSYLADAKLFVRMFSVMFLLTLGVAVGCSIWEDLYGNNKFLLYMLFSTNGILLVLLYFSHLLVKRLGALEKENNVLTQHIGYRPTIRGPSSPPKDAKENDRWINENGEHFCYRGSPWFIWQKENINIKND